MILIEYSVPAASYFRPVGLSSPQLRFTAVFGMGTGVAIAPNHQNTRFNIYLELIKLDAIRGASELCDQNVFLYIAGANEHSNEEVRQFYKF